MSGAIFGRERVPASAAGARRAVVVPELPLAIDGDAIAMILEADPKIPAIWLPALLFEREVAAGRRRALILADGNRVEVPATMRMVESLEVVEVPELLVESAERIGVTGFAMLPAGLALFCDPRRIAGERS